MNYGKFINESIVINPSEISLDGKTYLESDRRTFIAKRV